MRRRMTGSRRRPAAPGGTQAGGPALQEGWAEPGAIPGSWVQDWPWASAGDDAMTRVGLRAGYRLRRRDIRGLEAAGLLTVRRSWSGRVRYVATSGWLPERPRRGAPRRPGQRARLSRAGIALAAAWFAGRAATLAVVVLCSLLRLIPWWLLLAACAVVLIVGGPHTLLFPALLGVAVIKALAGMIRAVASQTGPPPAPPPLRKAWWR